MGREQGDGTSRDSLEELSLNEIEGSQEENLEDVDPEIGLKLDKWVSMANIENKEVTVHLYKFDDAKSGNEKMLIDTFKNDLMEQDSIGRKYGGGRYMMIVHVPAGKRQKAKTTCRRFRLHPRYDQLMREEQGFGNIVQPVYTPQRVDNSNNGLKEAFTMVQQVIQMLVPLINRPQQTQQNIDPLGMNRVLTDMMKANVKENMSLMSDMQRKLLNVSQPTGEDEEEDEKEPEEKKSLLDRLLPIAENFLPLLMKNDFQAKATAAGIRAIPEFTKIVKDTTEVNNLIRYLDKVKGTEAANIVLKNLRVKRPDGMAFVPAPGPRKVVKQSKQSKPLKKVEEGVSNG